MEINRIGKILNGKTQDWYIKLLDDTPNTGGYLLLQSAQIDFQGIGYDDWFINVEEAKQHITTLCLEIEWDKL